MTTFQQQYFINKGLNLKEVFVLVYLKKLITPTTINNFLKINPLIELNERNLRKIIYKLEKLNLIAKFKTSTYLIFIFPYLRSVKLSKKINFKKCKIKPNFIPVLGQKRKMSFTKYNYINNINMLKHKRHNVVNINSNIKTHYDDDIMSNKKNNINNQTNLNQQTNVNQNKINNFTSNQNTTSNHDKNFIEFVESYKQQLYQPQNLNSNNHYKIEPDNIKHKNVVTKNNYNFISSIKSQFKQEFPLKNNYIDTNLPSHFDFELFIEKIKQSKFLTQKHNLGFSWLLKRYDAIINDQYKDFVEKTETQSFISKEQDQSISNRQYSEEFFKSLFTDINSL